MDLLQYEFVDASEGSYFFILGELVKDIRYYWTNVTSEEFKKALPKLREQEAILQKIDKDICMDKRFYINEIMAELKKETEEMYEIDLLQYEFIDAAETSYNFILGKLVKDIRYYTTKVSPKEFKKALPSLREQEAILQKIDKDILMDKRYYIDEIMAELKKETEK